jgi:hypothetical protein
MEANDATATTKSQESMEFEEESKPEQCRGLLVQQNPKRLQGEQSRESFVIFCENMKKLNRQKWRCIKNHDNNIVLVKRGIAESLDIQCLDYITSLKYQDSASCNTISSNEEASAASVNSCDCSSCFSTLRNILNSASTEQWVCFWICRGKTYLSITDEQTNIPVEDFNQLETLVGQLMKLNNDAASIVNTRVPLGETENDVKIVITSHIISQEEFFKEVNEIVYQKRKILKKMNTLIYKHCGTAEDDSASKIEAPSNVAPAPVSRNTSANNDDLDALQAGGSIPLRTLLQCIVVRLTPSNWIELRRYVGRDVPVRVLGNIADNIDFFQELENRNMIQLRNTEYIRTGFYEIGRVDLVHLLDCIQDGDYSLLNPDTVRERRNRSDDNNLESRARSLVRQMRDLTADRGRNDNTADQSSLRSSFGANTQSSVSEMREMVVTDGQIARSPPNVAGNSTTRDRPLQRRYRNVPQRTTPSTAYPVQEQIEDSVRTQDQIPENVSNNEGDTSAGNTDDASIQSTNAEGSTPQSINSETTSPQGENTEDTPAQGENAVDTLPQGANVEGTLPGGENVEDTLPGGENVEGTLPGGENAEDTRAWVMSREYSCAHYDRYCNAQFACCEPFWPCHRCHNASSQCGETKLRSRDIKKLKCRRCGTVQDFPKESPNCVECNLKFAEYFCATCQHLTGEQNRPFHCAKCGICRYVP